MAIKSDCNPPIQYPFSLVFSRFQRRHCHYLSNGPSNFQSPWWTRVLILHTGFIHEGPTHCPNPPTKQRDNGETNIRFSLHCIKIYRSFLCGNHWWKVRVENYVSNSVGWAWWKMVDIHRSLMCHGPFRACRFLIGRVEIVPGGGGNGEFWLVVPGHQTLGGFK